MKPYKPRLKTKIKHYIYKKITYIPFCKWYTKKRQRAIKLWKNNHRLDVNLNTWKKIRRSVLYRNKKCKRCGSRKNLTVDHIVAIKKGGTSEYGNLQVLCTNCHTIKSQHELISGKTTPFKDLLKDFPI